MLHAREYAGEIHLLTPGYMANVIAHHRVFDPGVNFIRKPFQ